MKVRSWCAAIAAVTLVAACGNGDDSEGSGGNGGGSGDLPEPLILGFVPSQENDKLVEDAEQLGDMLGKELGVDVETTVPTDYAGLVVAMGTDQAHIGMFGPVALVQAVDQSGAEVVLQSVRRDSSTYHTQWFTTNPDRFCEGDVVQAENPEGNTFSYCNGTDSAESGPVGEEALKELEEGETIMFVDASSASGYYYPATQVQSVAGFDPLNGIDGQFAGDHTNAVLAVQRGDAEVGVSYDDARNDLLEENPTIGEDVVVFAWSAEIPNDGVAVSGELSDEAQQAITDAFMVISETEEGATALESVYGIEGLVEADVEALDVAREVAANFGEEE